MRVFRYLKDHIVATLLIFVLLIGQAFCDLALPRYTSDIVDVGIQQSGIEHASPSVLTERTHRALSLMVSEEGEALFERSYEQSDDGAWRLSSYGESHRGDLDELVAFPLAAVHASSQGFSGSGFDIDALIAAVDVGELTKDQVAGQLAEARAAVGDTDELVEQQGIAAAKLEYEVAGEDVSSMQATYLVRTALAMMGFVALGVLISSAVSLLAARTGARIGATLRSKLFARVVSFSDAEVQRFSAASLITRATNDVQQIQTTSTMLLRMVLYAPVLAIGGIIMVARTNVSMSWVIVLAVAVVLTVVVVLMAVAMPKFRAMQKLVDRVNLVAREMLTGVSVVRAFGRERHEQRRFDEASRALMGTQLFTNRVMMFMMPLMMLIMNGTAALIVWVGASAIDAGTLQTGDLIAFITYSMVIIMSFLMLGMLAVILPRADVSAQRIDEVLEAELSIADPDRIRALSLPASSETGAAIAFNDVSFKYRDSVECALSHVTFTAEAGKTTAIVGSTGSGKSTVIKLIERFYDVTEGSVTIDGVDVRDVAQHELRAQLGYVPQKAFLFSGTIASNIAYAEGAPAAPAESAPAPAESAPASAPVAASSEGAATASAPAAPAAPTALAESAPAAPAAPAALAESAPASAESAPAPAAPALAPTASPERVERIERAAEIAQALPFIEAKEEGFDAPISQGGTNVSGGQRQRLAIARALATDARAYLFDDSFSALDYKTDAALRRALAENMRGKTVVILAQRIATVLSADKIIVLDDGNVAGQGTHADLMENCSAYREIALSQLSAAELEGGERA